MDDKKRDDAADKAPRPVVGETSPSDAGSRKQEAPNYDVATDAGQSVSVEDMNSANDE